MTHVQWRKSSFSGTSSNCVEVARVPQHWRKSTFSGSSSNCVELAGVDDTIAVRNSNHPDAGTLALTRAEMDALLQGVKAGAFDDLAN